MDPAKIIFEKKFKPLTLEEFDKVMPLIDDKDCNETSSVAPHGDLVESLFGNLVRIMIPERLNLVESFVAMAKDVAERNEIDTTVLVLEDRYIARFHIDNESTSFGVRDIILFGDEITFGSAESGVLLDVLFYTHATYRSGQEANQQIM